MSLVWEDEQVVVLARSYQAVNQARRVAEVYILQWTIAKGCKKHSPFEQHGSSMRLTTNAAMTLVAAKFALVTQLTSSISPCTSMSVPCTLCACVNTELSL
jgi:hypothetical protein